MDLWSTGGGGQGQSVMKIIQCNGLPEIHARLAGSVCPRYLCIMLYVKLMWCSGLPWICGQLEEGGVGPVCHENYLV